MKMWESSLDCVVQLDHAVQGDDGQQVLRVRAADLGRQQFHRGGVAPGAARGGRCEKGGGGRCKKRSVQESFA